MQMVIKRGNVFVKGWKSGDRKDLVLDETSDMDSAMVFNCEQDARRFIRGDKRYVLFYQPTLASLYS